ncbi:uncharacterized protein LOC111372344 isoform X1 [Olea europaea var. sylvestris]|uniref:uncharacterized protein LOC111372344 isoform X1 n=1 Tax=Olea europaea var. sylvestris TaxID=158386 RepID=UPI000C1CE602|nr:uncharacterized protein LOC111372344 isoform X1 [Olea europaea var. sylvestris]
MNLMDRFAGNLRSKVSPLNGKMVFAEILKKVLLQELSEMPKEITNRWIVARDINEVLRVEERFCGNLRRSSAVEDIEQSQPLDALHNVMVNDVDMISMFKGLLNGLTGCEM